MPGYRCIVPFCSSSYLRKDGDIPKKHFFLVSKDPEKMEMWRKAIPRKDYIIKPGQVVCEDHFHESDIQRKFVMTDNSGKVLAETMYKIPKLKDGAIPSIFPGCPKYLNIALRNRKAPANRSSPVLKKRKIEINNSIDTVPLIDIECEELSSSVPEDLFANIQNSPISLPNDWSRHIIKDNLVMFHCFNFCIAENIVTPFLFKMVWVTKELKVYCKIINKQMEELYINQLSDINQLEETIKAIDSKSVCIGCDVNEKRNIDTSLISEHSGNSYLDSQKKLRHKSCTLVVEKGGSCCKYCICALNTLKRKTNRLRTQQNLPKMTRLVLDPTKKLEIQKRFKALRQQKNRAVKKMVELKKQLKSVEVAMRQLSSETLEDRLNKI